ncbi:MAG: mevalonate kinase family protein [Bacteroidota bacterium]
MKRDDRYFAKIMLFGEYSVILRSMALTIPYTHFNGSLQFILHDNYTDYQYARQSNLQLYHLLGYIRRLQQQEMLKSAFSIETFARDLSNGLYFESTIPQGYGLGSSGALIAALYQRYVKDRRITRRSSAREIIQLKEELSQLESFYHGTSSGLDPLNAYVNYPLLIAEEESRIELVKIPDPPQLEEGAVFIVNTGRPGKTGPLVNVFLERSKAGTIDSQRLIAITNKTIQALLNGDGKSFFEYLRSLSEFQYSFMRPMIPEDFLPLWKEGLKHDNYYLKLCGSGGGGFLLGFTQDFKATKEHIARQGSEVIPVYKMESLNGIPEKG